MSAAAGAGPSVVTEESTAPFDVGLFIDNDSKYINQVSPCDRSTTKLKTIEVLGTYYLEGSLLTSPEMKRHMDRLSKEGNAFGKAIHGYLKFAAKSEGRREKDAKEWLDEGCGIKAHNVSTIKQWVTANAGKKMAVLFDFDRTLTTIEGGFYVTNTVEDLKSAIAAVGVKTDGLTTEGMVDYYVGGPERVAMLQEMFDFLYSTGNVTIYILTNNKSCVQFPTIMMEMMNVLTKNRPVKLLCSASYGENKRAAILATEELKHLCPLRGGKKTRKGKGKKTGTRRR